MRVRTDFWAKAYLRRRISAGAMGAVVRHGDDMAGAIFIKINKLDGTAVVYGPAPQALDSEDLERRWMRLHKADTLSEPDADKLLEREAEFDSDLWIIEIEDRTGDAALEGWLAK